MNNINLEINDFGQIDEAKLKLKKINVIGGVNASGKSTASKLLYCFLRAMSQTRNQYILETYLPKINNFINMVENPHPYAEHGLPDKFTLDDDLSKILKAFDEANEKYDSISNIFKIPYEFLWIERRELNRMVSILKGDESKNYSSVVKSLFNSESLVAFKGKANFYYDSLKSSVSYEYCEEYWSDLLDRDANLKSEKNISFDDLDERFIYTSEGSFDLLPDVFYIDSISIFDLKYYLDSIANNNYEDSVYKEHIGYLLKVFSQKSDDVDENTEGKIKNVSDKIGNLIKGYHSTFNEIYSNNEDYYDDLLFIKINEIDANMSSGIQQIGIVEELLARNKLKQGTFLIIDEPEVNLHPEWQIKFAQILVIIAKELDVILYMNSHSPIFIEAISLYSQYYDLLNETQFYLTQKQDNGKYVFKKINPKNMGAVYENLTKPYDELDKLKAKILFKE